MTLWMDICLPNWHSALIHAVMRSWSISVHLSISSERTPACCQDQSSTLSKDEAANDATLHLSDSLTSHSIFGASPGFQTLVQTSHTDCYYGWSWTCQQSAPNYQHARVQSRFRLKFQSEDYSLSASGWTLRTSGEQKPHIEAIRMCLDHLQLTFVLTQYGSEQMKAIHCR